MMIIRGVNVYPSQVEAVLVGIPDVAPHYQIVLTREGALDTMTVEIEIGGRSAQDEAFRGRKSGEIARAIKSHFGVSCTIALKSPGELPRSQARPCASEDLRERKTELSAGHSGAP